MYGPRVEMADIDCAPRNGHWMHKLESYYFFVFFFASTPTILTAPSAVSSSSERVFRVTRNKRHAMRSIGFCARSLRRKTHEQPIKKAHTTDYVVFFFFFVVFSSGRDEFFFTTNKWTASKFQRNGRNPIGEATKTLKS